MVWEMSMLGTAIKIAAAAHEGQYDKGGRPYILHPLRVMAQMQFDDERMVAILHDVLEDSTITADDLLEADIPIHVLCAIQALTRNEGEDYHAFTERVSWNALATRVKIADLRDNMDTTRLASPLSDSDIRRLQKYHRALVYLQGEAVNLIILPDNIDGETSAS